MVCILLDVSTNLSHTVLKKTLKIYLKVKIFNKIKVYNNINHRKIIYSQNTQFLNNYYRNYDFLTANAFI